MVLTPPFERTLPILAARAGAYFPELSGGPVDLTPRHLVHRSTYPIYLVELRGAATVRRIVVKFAPVFPENNEGRTEFDNMSLLWREAAQADPDLGFVRALDFLEETDALVMEFVEADRLSPRMMRGSCYGAAQADCAAVSGAARLAGRWLRVMHKTTASGTLALEDAPFLGEFERLLGLCEECGLLNGWRQAIRRFLDAAMPVVRRFEAPMALVHGDFGPQNMAISGSRLYVFDLQRNFQEVIYHDVAYFLVTLRTLNPYPQYPRFSRRRLMGLSGPFLDGYFGREPSRRERTLLELLYLRNLVERSVKQYRGSAHIPAGAVIARAAIAAFYPRLLRAQLQSLEMLLA